jgi:hypothetical protein
LVFEDVTRESNFGRKLRCQRSRLRADRVLAGQVQGASSRQAITKRANNMYL